MDDADLLPSNLLGMLESKSEDALRSLAGDELDALHNSVNDNMLNSRVFSLSVLTDQDNVNIVVWSLVAGNGSARAEVSKEVEGSSEGQVERNMSLANGGLVEPSVICMYILVHTKVPELTARGPFKATKFFLTLAIASSGIAVFPFFKMGVTSTGSHLIGTCDQNR